jgi:hypothetical protein
MKALVVYYWMRTGDRGIDNRFVTFNAENPNGDEIKDLLNSIRERGQYNSVRIVNIIRLHD